MPDEGPGARLIIARAASKAQPLVDALRSRGWDATALAAIETAPADPAPLREALRRVGDYDLVAFTSANAVRAVVREGAAVPGDGWRGVTIAAVGPATAEALARDLRAPDVVAAEHGAMGLADAIGEVRGRRVLLPRGDLARDDLPRALREGGAQVDEVVCYRTVPHADAARIAEAVRTGGADAILFYSPSAVDAVIAALRDAPRPVAICLGATTAAAAHQAGFPVGPVPERAEPDAVLACLDQWLASRST